MHVGPMPACDFLGLPSIAAISALQSGCMLSFAMKTSVSWSGRFSQRTLPCSIACFGLETRGFREFQLRINPEYDLCREVLDCCCTDAVLIQKFDAAFT